MKLGITHRLIDGVQYICIDVGCDNLDRATYNRKLVKEQLFTDWWRDMERTIAAVPSNRALPSWIPVNEQLRPLTDYTFVLSRTLGGLDSE